MSLFVPAVAYILLQAAPQAAQPATPSAPVIKIMACADGAHSEQSSEGVVLCQSVDEKGKLLPPPAPAPPAPDTQPELVYSADPVYPDIASVRSIEGDCTLVLTVDTNGLPQNVRIVKSLSPEIDAVAVAAVLQYRFKPATRNGVPVATKVAVRLAFHVASR